MLVVGARIRLARTFRDLTLQELSVKVASSPTALSQIENGKKQPRTDLLEAIAGVLGFEPDFFFESVVDEFTEAECSFRKRTTTPERDKKRVLAHGTLFGEVVRYLNETLALPEFDVPNLPVENAIDVEMAAERCRIHWKLGIDAPILRVARVLERAGVVVTQFEGETKKVDAFSRYGQVCVIVLNTAKGSTSRGLFDIAHETGHLVMHRMGKSNTPEREAQADLFASAFLLPRQGFSRDFTAMRKLDWPHLLELKRHWRVSAAALIRRAFDLRLIDAAEYRRLNAARMARGYHRGEPAEPTAEPPELLRMSFSSLERKKGEAAYAVAKKLHWSAATLEAVVGFPVEEPCSPEMPTLSLSSFREKREASKA
jgi:Zn-dependent peptidase ImmA (M78 family)/transcriptional regulator with XRE-family HTH domain